MKSIYKYELETTDYQTLDIQSDTILSVQEQYGKIVVYALVNTENPTVRYEFGIIGTGNPITIDIEDYKFLNTIKLFDGKLMFHVFYKKYKD